MKSTYHIVDNEMQLRNRVLVLIPNLRKGLVPINNTAAHHNDFLLNILSQEKDDFR